MENKKYINALVVADSISDLTAEQNRLREIMKSQQLGEIHYFCSAIDIDRDIPKDIEQKLIKVRDHKEFSERNYAPFLDFIEKTYHQLCEKFNYLYGSCFSEFNVNDLPQYEATTLLMEYVRIYDFLKYFCRLNEITRIIILRRGRMLADWGNGVYDHLRFFPIDSAVAEIIAKECCIEFIILKNEDFGMKRLSSLFSQAKHSRPKSRL